jgi:hypothetical protein
MCATSRNDTLALFIADLIGESRIIDKLRVQPIDEFNFSGLSANLILSRTGQSESTRFDEISVALN